MSVHRWVSDFFDRHPALTLTVGIGMVGMLAATDVSRLRTAYEANGTRILPPVLLGVALALATAGCLIWLIRNRSGLDYGTRRR